MSFSTFVDEVLRTMNKESCSATPEDFLFDAQKPLPQLSKAQTLALQKYQDGSCVKKPIVVADLNQNPEKRPRWGQQLFPCLTTNCAKLMHLPSKQLYSQGLGLVDGFLIFLQNLNTLSK